jgi:hypothetical protein
MKTTDTPTKYCKGSIEARIDSLLPQFPSFDVIAHELWGDGEGGWSVNDSWHLGRDCDREETISHLGSRRAIFFGHHSWQGSHFYYMRAAVNGKKYSLRGFGVGMIAKGKALK